MTHSLSALVLLKQEIAEKKEALEALEKALATYERHYSNESASTASSAPQLPFALDAHPNAHKKTLREHIIDVINSWGTQEFSVVEIHNALRAMGVEPKGQHPKNRIITLMRKLENDGVIKQTYQGKGSAPHRFEVVL